MSIPNYTSNSLNGLIDVNVNSLTFTNDDSEFTSSAYMLDTSTIQNDYNNNTLYFDNNTKKVTYSLNDMSYNEISQTSNFTHNIYIGGDLTGPTIDDLYYNSTTLQSEISTLQTNTSAVSFDASNNDTNINSNCTIWEYLTLYGNLNNLTPLQITMLDSLETDTPVEQRLYELENFRNTYLNNFFYFVEVPVPNFYDIYFTSGNIHLGNNVDCSGNFTFGNTLNGISQTVFNYLSGVSSSIQSQFSNLENNISTISQKLTQVSYNPSVLYTDIQNNVSVTGNLNCNTLNGISSSNISYLSGTTSSIQNQFNSITQKLTGFGYNSENDFSDFTNNVSIYGNFYFTGVINSIPRSTFMYIQNVTSDIQSQFNSLVSSINSISTN